MTFSRIPLRTGLDLTILAIGLVTIALVTLSGHLYFKLALESQRTALIQVATLESGELLRELEQNATSLGRAIQNNPAFRKALDTSDSETLTTILADNFHQYFVTAGVLKLEKLTVLDRDFSQIAAASTPDRVTAYVQRACSGFRERAGQRDRADRLKPYAEICNSNGYPYHVLVVPVGLKPAGYIEVVTDPAHAMIPLESALGMPLGIYLVDGTPLYQSANPESFENQDAGFAATFRLHDSSGSPVLELSMYRSFGTFFEELRHTRNLILLIVALVTLGAVVSARLIVGRIVLTPLQNLSTQLREAGHGLSGEGGDSAAITHEFAELRELYDALQGMALTDALTGLPNRIQLERRVHTLLETAAHDNRQHCLCYLDLDQFKVINDSAGHLAGDELLRQVAELLGEHVRQDDLVARIGGDEFAILFQDCPAAKATRIAEAIREAIEGLHFIWEGRGYRIGASIGLVPLNASSGTLMDSMSAADAACYVAKDKGRNRVHVCGTDDRELRRRQVEMQWITRIKGALQGNSLMLYQQPIMEITPSRTTCVQYEILLRMRDEESGGVILPGEFIPAAERYQLMPQLDQWVITNAFGWLAGPGAMMSGQCSFSINLSAQSLCDDKFLQFVIGEVDRFDIEPESVCFEITETAAIENLARARRFVSVLKGIGCRFSLDDFGAGLSSFTHLKALDIDYMKIDGSFIRGMVENRIDRELVGVLNQIGRIMNVRTIAECVEDERTRTAVVDAGIAYIQGYYFAVPAPLDDLVRADSRAAMSAS